MLSFGPPRDCLLALCCLFVLGFTFQTSAQDDEDSPYRPGLVATYSAVGETITRTDETIAFDWQDSAPDPRLSSGEFTTTWRGRLWARGAGQYHLHAFVQGQVTVKLAGKTLIEGKNGEGQSNEPKWLQSQPLDLEFDHHPLEVTYRRGAQRGQLALFWSGPDFRLEPIPAWALLHDKLAHEKTDSPSHAFERGRQLATALRCAACHKDTTAAITTASINTASINTASINTAPALDRLSGNINEQWLIGWLAPPTDDNKGVSAARRMPHLNITHQEATAIAAYLLREPPIKTEPKNTEQKVAKEDSKKKSDTKSTKKSKGEEKPKPSAEEGEKLLLTRGCLACHQLGPFGLSGLFGGGDLTSLTSKRPADFLTRWLADPASINRNHRMPVFPFTADEITSLNLWAKQQSAAHKPDAQARENGVKQPETLERGQKLVESLKCGSCHSLSRDKNATPIANQKELTAASNWTNSCTSQPNRAKNQPGYHLTATDATALKDYYSTPKPGASHLSQQSRGRDLLAQLNCLACHQREGVDRSALLPLPLGEGRGEGIVTSFPPLQDKLPALAEAHSQLAPLIPAMTPPALNSVGDKLQDQALADSITRKGRPHRPYLLVQMPKFELSKPQLEALTAYFTSTDRIPPVPANLVSTIPNPKSQIPNSDAALLAAGPRLVTTDGLACTSCHQVGSVLPTKAPLNARGPDMSMLGSRIRREWFDRWCNNPARIVPRMEMPAVKIPVRGVLNDNVEDQLAAVWHILNTPGFQPPEPDPVRVLRLSGLPEKNERPLVIHDIFKDGDKTYLFPLVIGLPNRHNILFDLETNRLAAWWLGDTARQRTKGKSWYWEMGGKPIHLDQSTELGPTLLVGQTALSPTREGQFVKLGNFFVDQQSSTAIQFECDLTYPGLAEHEKPIVVRANQIIRIKDIAGRGVLGFNRFIHLTNTPRNSRLRLPLVDAKTAEACRWDKDNQTLYLPGVGEPTIRIEAPDTFVWDGNGTVLVSPYSSVRKLDDEVWVNLEYRCNLAPDQFIAPVNPPTSVRGTLVDIAPGFVGRCLPLPNDIMPTAFSWDAKNNLVFACLKGAVYSAADTDADNFEDNATKLADGLATPYGVHVIDPAIESVAKKEIDVITKSSLLRLGFGTSLDDPTYSVEAAGWGATDDYHDWAVGLTCGEKGEYYIALPCQQDQRPEPAAKYRGQVLKLKPRQPTPDNRQHFDIEVISAGHRFPMGMARNRDGELFVTDNQGNYNPFNELNHVKPGAHFGFINALEKEKGFTPPPLTEPAINIPHPWTRSVNGICFLETPSDLRPLTSDLSSRRSLFGPIEGHLVGCEYDTRRLIRMSLDKVNGEYQGCCYPLSIPPADIEKGLLGPIVCAVKPTTGELYVGEIRDSGWGASNNIGQIVKIKIEPENLPCGIAEVKATKTGFTIDFFQPVDKTKAADVSSYSLESYRRESTPAYGGSDIDRRPEKITKAELSPDAKRITLTLENLRPRHVYEFRLKNLASDGGVFHPDEAHYTLKQIPN